MSEVIDGLRAVVVEKKNPNRYIINASDGNTYTLHSTHSFKLGQMLVNLVVGKLSDNRVYFISGSRRYLNGNERAI